MLRSQARFAQGTATKDPLLVASVGVADPSQAQDDTQLYKGQRRTGDSAWCRPGERRRLLARWRPNGEPSNRGPLWGERRRLLARWRPHGEPSNEGPLWGKCCPQVADATSGAAASAASSVEDWLS